MKLPAMKQQERIRFLYSLSSGYNFYELASHEKYTIFGKAKSVIRHIKTGDLFYITEFSGERAKRFNVNSWISLLRKPVDLQHFIWPVDIISWQDNNTTEYALVFPLRAMPTFSKLSDVLSDDEHLGWRQGWVKELVADFLNAWSNFDFSGYAYHEFSEQNMFYHSKTHNVMFDFSFSTHKAKSIYSAQYVSPSNITPEYADSFYYTEDRHSEMDLASDYYSIAVILFKLLIGRLPYQGTVMEHEPDTTPKEHENWLRIYHKNPYFIFDEQDETNRIGGDSGFAKDEIFVERWNELPKHVRNMFHNVFQTANVMRTAGLLMFYSPEQWRDALFGDTNDIPLVYRETRQQDITADDTTIELHKQSSQNRTFIDATRRETGTRAREKRNSGSNSRQNNKSNFQPSTSDYYNVVITGVPVTGKIIAIKVVKDITGASLTTVKQFIEAVPTTIAQGITLELAQKVQKELSSASIVSELRHNQKFNARLEDEISQRLANHWTKLS